MILYSFYFFFSTKSFCSNTLHCWYSALGINSCQYVCFFGSHLSKVCAQLATSDFTSNFFQFTQKYLPVSIISTSHFLYPSLLILPFYTYLRKKKNFWWHEILNKFSRFALAIPTGAPKILLNKIIDTSPLVALKTIKAWSI